MFSFNIPRRKYTQTPPSATSAPPQLKTSLVHTFQIISSNSHSLRIRGVFLPQHITMSAAQPGRMRELWYKWKSLRLPWRKKWLVGSSPFTILAATPSSIYSIPCTAQSRSCTNILKLQVAISQARHSGNSTPPSHHLALAE